MKKIFTLLASLLMYSAVWAQSPILSEGGVNYYVLDEDAKTAYVGSSSNARGTISILSEVGGYTVTSIGDEAFDSNRHLYSVVIPENVTSIGAQAFYFCDDLASVTFANNSKLTSIGKSAFSLCSDLASITLPATVISIGENAFGGCNLADITIPEGVESIGARAFYECDELTSISIPKTVTFIGERAFSNCPSITTMEVAADNLNYTSTVNGTACNAILSKDGTTLLHGCKNSVVPAGVTSIGASAFYYCDELTDITLPASVTTIGAYAFKYCDGLTSITLPANVTSIEDDAFFGCDNLYHVYCWANPEELTWTDGGCDDFIKDGLGTTCHVPANYLSTYEEKWDTGSEGEDGTDVNVDFVDDLPSWSNDCWTENGVNYYIDNETNTAYVGKSPYATGDITIRSEVGGYPVTSIGDEAFSENYSINSVVIPENVTSIGTKAFYNCPFLKNVSIPSSVTSIADEAFENCGRLESVTFADDSKLTSIGKSAFSLCYDLANITIPETVTSIGEEAFYGCKFANITIPEGVESIGIDAFYGCYELTSISIPKTVTFIGDGAFSNCPSITTMEVAADNPHYTSTVNGIACNAILSKDGLTLLNGCMNSVVPAGVTRIAARAFKNCEGLTSITLPASVTKIEKDAFLDCDNLEDVYCWANPEELTWTDGGCNDFKYNGKTECHVPANYVNGYRSKWSLGSTGEEGTDVHVNFVGDLVVLEDKAANSITTSSDKQVVLSGRTLYRDGYWNTICLPFDVDADYTVLEGATVKTLTDATLTDGTLTLNFADATDANDKDCDEDTDEFYMEAGKPYIIRWGTPEDPSTDLINPVFEYVDITAAEPSSVVCKDENDKTVITFQGLYDCRNFTATDKSILYLGSNNTLYYPKPAEGSTMTIGAFRALFQLGEGITAGEPSSSSQIKAFVMNFGDEGNGISEIHADPSSDAGWYTIDGRRLMEEPKDRGMYIFKGRKVMIK